MGLAIGLALMFYGSHTHGEGLLHEMLGDNNAYVRMGLGLAYVGNHHSHRVITE